MQDLTTGVAVALCVSAGLTAPGFAGDTSSFEGLGFLFDGDRYSEATSISADGQVVVGGSVISHNGLEAFRWTFGSGMQGLGHLNSGNDLYSRALDVTPDGSVVVGYSMVGLASIQAVRGGRACDA